MPETEAKQILRFGTFEVDHQTGELRREGVRVKLQDQPFLILLALLERPGEVVTREELRARLWPSDTFVDFDHGLNAAVKRLRDALGDTADNPRFIETLAKRGYRFLAPVNGRTVTPGAVILPVPPEQRVSGGEAIPSNGTSDLLVRHKARLFVAVAAVAVGILGFPLYRWLFPTSTAHALTEKDTIVLADFTNMTGDAVFDDALRQGLSVQLEQSPFLRLISDRRIQQTLRLMAQPANAKLTPEISREVCQRVGSKADIEGSIAQIGAQYSLILAAVACASGDVLIRTETRASDKSQVLNALGKAASDLRAKLGESLTTVQKYDTPLEQATTSSLEALKAYSLGRKALEAGYADAAVGLFQRAIRLDPNFAMAYASLGQSYQHFLLEGLPAENTRKAYELRERVSEREKFYIESHYHQNVTGDLQSARKAYELWTQVYPRDALPHGNLAGIYSQVGQHEKALEQAREGVQLEPSGMGYVNLVSQYRFQNRLEEARAAFKEAQAKNFDSPELHFALHDVAFYQNDVAGMKELEDWARGKDPEEGWMMGSEAWMKAHLGKIENARQMWRRVIASAQQEGNKEFAGRVVGEWAWLEATIGNTAVARRLATAALTFTQEKHVQCSAALALAAAGEAPKAQALAVDLGRRFSKDTVVQSGCVPIIHARVALSRHQPSKAIELLQVTSATELGSGDFFLYAPYVRGEAYLAAHQGGEAAVEFKKVLDHLQMLGFPFGRLAHLQVARAYAMQGNSEKAKAAYQDFFTHWKDADADIPILIAAKAEYAKLQ